MKKILLLMILVTTVVVLSACGRDNTVLRVGMDLRYPPFETTTLQNDPEGISVDVAYALGAFLGRDVEIVNMNFGNLIPALNSGSIDIVIASMSITAARQEQVDFTNPYFYFKIISLVNKSFANANNLTENSTKEELLAVSDTKFVGIASQVSVTIPESYGKTVTEAVDLGSAIQSVAGGFTDVLMMSANPVLDGYNANKSTTMVIWDPLVSSPIGMAVKKGNTELLEKANEFIATMDQPGGLYGDLFIKWDNVLLEKLGRFGLSFYINE
jgi:polar amino acid transport system substrate-binding protein